MNKRAAIVGGLLAMFAPTGCGGEQDGEGLVGIYPDESVSVPAANHQDLVNGAIVVRPTGETPLTIVGVKLVRPQNVTLAPYIRHQYRAILRVVTDTRWPIRLEDDLAINRKVSEAAGAVIPPPSGEADYKGTELLLRLQLQDRAKEGGYRGVRLTYRQANRTRTATFSSPMRICPGTEYCEPYVLP